MNSHICTVCKERFRGEHDLRRFYNICKSCVRVIEEKEFILNNGK